MANNTRRKMRRRAVMLGVALDTDGHKRLTTGPNFLLMGGTQESHEAMTEKVVMLNEKLAAAGKRLEQIGRDEFRDLAHSVGLREEKPDPHDG